MAEKELTYFEQLQAEAAKAQENAQARGPELQPGVHQFTIIGGTHGTKEGRDWSAVVVRHTNGHEYRLFYNLYWPLKEGELTPQLNVSVFNWICAFDRDLLSDYKGEDFDKYFDALVGKQFEIEYVVNKRGRVVVNFNKLPIALNVLEEELSVDEINFDEI